MAEVKVTEMKECPMLTTGTITPLIMQSWTLACKCYMKHGSHMASEIVSIRVVVGSLRPHAGQSMTRLYIAYMRYNWDLLPYVTKCHI
jgi:hypothetical protein